MTFYWAVITMRMPLSGNISTLYTATMRSSEYMDLAVGKADCYQHRVLHRDATQALIGQVCWDQVYVLSNERFIPSTLL